MPQLDDHDLVKSLGSTRCPACGGKKKRAQTFCGREVYDTLRSIRRAEFFK
jgi:hypothetical protein